MKFTDEHRSDSNTAANPKLWAKCQAEAKRKFKIHPSAFSNGYASKIYKERGGTWRSDSLDRWFKEKWVGINSSGKIVGGCGDGETKGKVKCLPASMARSLSKKDRSRLAKRKQAQDPKPGREGAPVMVSSKLDAMDPAVLARAIDRINEKYGLRIDSSPTVSKWLVHFSGRNTGAVVHATSRSRAISRAREKKVTGWEGKVDAARLCTDRELAMIKKGTWIRTRANGKETGGAYRFRSWMKK